MQVRRVATVAATAVPLVFLGFAGSAVLAPEEAAGGLHQHYRSRRSRRTVARAVVVMGFGTVRSRRTRGREPKALGALRRQGRVGEGQTERSKIDQHEG